MKFFIIKDVFKTQKKSKIANLTHFNFCEPCSKNLALKSVIFLKLILRLCVKEVNLQKQKFLC